MRRELLPNQSPALLKALHLLTRDGDLNADARRKLKQVNHLVGLLEPALSDTFARFPSPTIVDVGSGSSYLGFILYELFLAKSVSSPGPAGPRGEGQQGEALAGQLVSVESRPELTAKAEERARELGYSRMRFVTSDIATAAYPERIHVLTALHACDTATDDALAVAIQRGVDHVAVVPCCQAEVAQLLKDARPKVDSAVQALFAHAWHRREFGSHLTNVIRALTLESFGYVVTVTELAGWEHSLKNELILGRRVHRESREARARLDALLAATGVRPKLVRTLLDTPPVAAS